MDNVEISSRILYVPERSIVDSAPLFTKFTLAGQLFVRNSYILLNFVTFSANSLVADSMSQEWWTDGKLRFPHKVFFFSSQRKLNTV
jgi:hypothetical protein